MGGRARSARNSGGRMGGGAGQSSTPRQRNARSSRTPQRHAGDVFGGLAPRGMGGRRGVGGRELPTPVDVRTQGGEGTETGRAREGGILNVDLQDIASLFSSKQDKRNDGTEFNAESLAEPYKKYAEDPEDGWITGLMRSGERGYDLPKEVTLAAAMKSPFRYYGGY